MLTRQNCTKVSELFLEFLYVWAFLMISTSPGYASLTVYLNDGGSVVDNGIGDLDPTPGILQFNSSFTLYPYIPDPLVQMHITTRGTLTQTVGYSWIDLTLSDFDYRMEKTGPDYDWGYLGPWGHGISFHSDDITFYDPFPPFIYTGPLVGYASVSGTVSYNGSDSGYFGITPLFGNIPIGFINGTVSSAQSPYNFNETVSSVFAPMLNPNIGAAIGLTVPYLSEIELHLPSSLTISATPIPSPSALLLLIYGLAGVVGLRRKRLLK